MNVRSECVFMAVLLSILFYSVPLPAQDPTFSTRIVVELDFAPTRGIPAFLDDDSIVDLVVSNSGGIFYSLINTGDLDFIVVWSDTSGGDIKAFRLTDVDADGRDDIVSLSSQENQLTVLFGEGQGVFNLGDVVPVGRNPVAIASGEFDGDDPLDLAVVNQDDDTVLLLHGDGQGGFTYGDTLQTGYVPMGIVSGDFDRDGDLDLAVSNYLTDDVVSYLGDGTGRFSPIGSYPASNGPYGLVGGDFNEDAVIDLAVPSINSRAIAILIGAGDGTFQREKVIPLTGDVTWIEVGDIDQDGHLDLLASDGGSLAVLWGDGMGGFDGPMILPVTSWRNYTPTDGAIADVDGDGLSDCISFHRMKNVSIVRGLAGRSFRVPDLYPVVVSPQKLLIEDFNEDGRPDVLAMEEGAGSAVFLPGREEEGFGPPEIITDLGPHSHTIVGRFTNDAHLDLAGRIYDWPSDSLWFTLGVGNGTFSPPLVYDTGARFSVMTGGDFNEDGITDIAIGDSMDEMVKIYLVSGLGVPSFFGEFDLPERPASLLADDFNSDGHLDLAVTFQGTWPETFVRFYKGDGRGDFTYARELNAGERVVGLISGEFRENVYPGYPDVVIVTRTDWPYSYSAELWVNSGFFGFTKFVTIDEGEMMSMEAVAGHFNDDNHLDLMIVREGSFFIHPGDGTGSFSTPDHGFGFSVEVSDVGIGDLNGDGLHDVVIASTEERRVDVILDLGGGVVGIGNDHHDGNTVPLPRSFSLFQNYPNPFNPSTTIGYHLPQGNTGKVAVSIRIYDIRGRLIRELVDEEKEPGMYRISWDGRDDRGRSLPSGVYICRMVAGDFRSTRKLLLMK